MAKRKYPSELNSRSIRVDIGDWRLLLDLSRKLRITVAEAFHEVLNHKDSKAAVLPAQLRMVDYARSTPVSSTRARSTPVSSSFSREV